MTRTISNSFSPALCNNSKVIALESTLHQSLVDFKDLLTDLEQLHIESDKCKTQLMQQKQKCESNTCSSAEELKKVIETKDNIIQLVASTVTKLSETKNWSIIDEIYKILFEETSPPYQKNIPIKEALKPTVKEEQISPKQEVQSPMEDVSFNDESISEIGGTPTGRTSPIIPIKKLKSSGSTTSERDKKKCSDSWPTPEPKNIKLEPKTIKLLYSTPIRNKKNTTLRQSRLNIVKVKSSSVIDITSSPEFSGGSRSSQSETECNIQPLIKKESIENDDTILPSPTSGPTNFTLFKSPMKFKKPPLSLKTKTEKTSSIFKRTDPDAENKSINIKKENKTMLAESPNKMMEEIKMNNSETYTQDDSINILHPKRPTTFIKSSPAKAHNDTTYCETQAHSVSLLQQVNNLDDIQKVKAISPKKSPLAENINVSNIPDDDELHSSMSLLQRDIKPVRAPADNVKRKMFEPVVIDEDSEPPRTRKEKLKLPGWACQQCVDFYGELYKDEPEKMQQKINECSHHRGVNNPERPKTPPGYWNPRWQVPENTEEFNRRNNV